MSRRKRRASTPAPTASAHQETLPTASAAPAPARRRQAIGAGLTALLAVALLGWLVSSRLPVGAADVAPAAPPTHVGSAACAGCHAEQHRAWQGSDHQLAMQPANEATVLGDFADARFTHAGVTTRFWTRDGRYYVTTDGPDGKLADFEIAYTFGVRPLQQYLIALPGGRLQAFGIAWDARPKPRGGQRWFHLYPRDRLKAGDALHWTGVNQNWNFMCAECHSTDLRKNHDAAHGRFDTAWAEISVGCEACHGPGSAHLAWAAGAVEQRASDPGMGLTNRLDERRHAFWTPSDGAQPPRRSVPRPSTRELDTCARCHARASRLNDSFVHGAPPLDSHRPALLDPGLYWNDGQQRDEVFTWGSFVQSKMHARGVSCSDCHEPHNLALRAPGNAVCGQCHRASDYDAPTHHHHAPGSPGAACTACHMPPTTYMRIDPRHDHSLRIPRPDLSVKHGLATQPNACNQCHDKQSPAWAAATVRRWSGREPQGFQHFAEAFHAAEAGDPLAGPALQTLIDDGAQPALVRASAIARLAALPSPRAVATLRARLADGDALVRLAAVEALAPLPPAPRADALAPLLGDAVLAVRSAAARALAGPAERLLAPADQTAFTHALREYLATLEYNADRPEAHMSWGNLLATRGDPDGAETHYRRALALDAGFVAGYVNLADLLRARGPDGEREAEATLRRGLASQPAATPAPEVAPLHYALGLSLIRQQRRDEAVKALAEASRRDPDNARYAYVHGVALHGSGAHAKAIAVLRDALRRRPHDAELLVALAQFLAQAGHRAEALEYIERLHQQAPDNPQYRELAAQILGGRQR